MTDAAYRRAATVAVIETAPIIAATLQVFFCGVSGDRGV